MGTPVAFCKEVLAEHTSSDAWALGRADGHAAVLQVHPPTGVTHAVAGFITRAEPRGQSDAPVLPDLAVARGTLLQIYSVRCSPTPGQAAWQSPAE
jgi:hypothetical protein